jgi:hypothetical protein
MSINTKKPPAKPEVSSLIQTEKESYILRQGMSCLVDLPGPFDPNPPTRYSVQSAGEHQQEVVDAGSL